jgi:hypothetical protein
MIRKHIRCEEGIGSVPVEAWMWSAHRFQYSAD